MLQNNETFPFFYYSCIFSFLFLYRYLIKDVRMNLPYIYMMHTLLRGVALRTCFRESAAELVGRVEVCVHGLKLRALTNPLCPPPSTSRPSIPLIPILF